MSHPIFRKPRWNETTAGILGALVLALIVFILLAFGKTEILEFVMDIVGLGGE